MKGYVGITDNDWFEFLAKQPGIDEVNFWQPGGRSRFQVLSMGEPFLFKLHSPHNFVVGGGFFAHSSILPISLAWKSFLGKNGASSILQMRRRTEKYRRTKPAPFEDYKIGCIILTQPFFFPRDQWIPVPQDFSINIVQGKTYDLTRGHGLHLWEQIQDRLSKEYFDSWVVPDMSDQPQKEWGKPLTIFPRLGQGAFRVLVTDTYQRRCAVTREKTLPALEAAHIKPFSEDGPHSVDNGFLLRSDIHRLFDSGYVTVTTNHQFEVSNRIKEEFDNGEEYRVLHGKKIWVPQSVQYKPGSDYLTWHNENVFRG